MQQNQDYGSTAFSGYGTKFFSILGVLGILTGFAIAIFVNAGEEESNWGFNFDIFNMGLMTWMALKLKFLHVRDDKLILSDFTSQEEIGLEQIMECRLVVYNVYSIRLRDGSRYGKRVYFARSLRKTFVTLFTKWSLENEEIRQLREFAALNARIQRIAERHQISLDQ